MEVLVQKFFIQPYLYLQINFLSLVSLFPFSSQNISRIKNSVICHLYTFKYQIFHKLKKIRQKLSCSNVAFHKGLTNYKFIDSVKRECIVAITRKRERETRVDLKSTDEGTKREYYAFYEDYPQCDASLGASVFPCCIHI